MFVAGMIYTIYMIYKKIRNCSNNDNTNIWLPNDDGVYFDPEPNIGWTFSNRNIEKYKNDNTNLHTFV